MNIVMRKRFVYLAGVPMIDVQLFPGVGAGNGSDIGFTADRLQAREAGQIE